MSGHSLVSKNKNHCNCDFLCLNFPSLKMSLICSYAVNLF